MNSESILTESTPKTMVLRNRDSGFFSNFNCVLNNLRHRLGANGIQAATVEWRTIPEFTEFPYGKPEDGNLWLHFFEPLPFDHFPEERVDIRKFATYYMTGRRAYAIHIRNKDWRGIYHDIYRRYIRLQPAIEERLAAFERTYMEGHYRVGVHYRNSAIYGEVPFPVPRPEVFAAWARRLLPRKKPSVVFLATDVEEAVDVFKDRFGDQLIVQPDVQRAPVAVDRQLHCDHPNPSLTLGEQVLADCLLMARCDALVYVASNVATAAGYINPDLKLVYCQTRRQAAYGAIKAWNRLRKITSEKI